MQFYINKDSDVPMSKDLVSKSIKALPAKASATGKMLLKLLKENISHEDIKHFDSDLFTKMSNSHWNLSKRKEPGQSDLHIYRHITTNQKFRKTIIDIISDDMAFLVDSIVAEINRNNLLIDFIIHPILYTKYDSAGNLLNLSQKPKDGYIGQSHVHIHIAEIISNKRLIELEKGLYTAINDVFFANRDWKAMLERLKETKKELAVANIKENKKESNKYCDFLNYLYKSNFTLLGYREYKFSEDKNGVNSKIVKGKSLGLLHDEILPAYISEDSEGLPRNLQKLRHNLPPVSVSKTNRLSTVHRSVPMDAIAIKTYDSKGKVIGERLFLGLFTSVTYSRSVRDVPLLREKIEEIIELSGFLKHSHDRREIRHILEKYPRDELFQISNQELYKICIDILRLQERQRIAIFIRKDPFKRYISCLVYIPRDRFKTSLRKRIGKILEKELTGTLSNFYTSLDDTLFARVMFMINVSQKTPPKFDPEKIQTIIQKAGQTWQERLEEALSKTLEDEQEIKNITLKYGEAFPIEYTSYYQAIDSIFDIKKLEAALTNQQLEVNLYQTNALEKHQFQFKVYNPGSPINLSDVIPILDDMGLRAISELPFKITPANEETPIWIHDFLLETSEINKPVVINKIKNKFETSFTKIWYKKIDSDALNALVLSAAMDWDETIILRSYVRYLKQINYPFGRLFIEKTLIQYPEITRLIIDYFKALHDPLCVSESEKNAVKYISAIEEKMKSVISLDQDRILHSILNLVQSTLRTNYFLRDENGERKPCFAIKLDSKNIYDLPAPKPFCETFVYSRRVEAIHLRGDKIARGGLRWSDRHEDYRTEILGLMKAQMVKNAVIIPTGSKGGFVVKTSINEKDKYIEEGIECYKIFLRGILDITDNRKGNKIIPPKNVVRRDGNDPYLVVAADKGTAVFSDIANNLSQEYDFWLDDAFASGGSAGYDHKEMGITARGAWESVKLHFRQLNHNIQEQDFDVVGIGDMSGDVFGNGLVLSKHIKMIGAFNHLHIFCDPDPDPKSSFKERKKLFDNVQGWDHYDTKKLSKGGRIFSRSDKVLTLTPEIRKRFDINKSKISPLELINALLKARTDLLWFGGIGTYVKSSNETDADVGDKANDSLRINATQLRAKVIGEGANLGVTQLGRIEFSKKGGMINTDFLDNSGGVDSSDHEVNIKIMFTDIMSQKTHNINIDERNKLLKSMTEEVIEHVLNNNYQQAQAISMAEMHSYKNIKLQSELIQDLERNYGLDRAVEYLPDQETIERRLAKGKGLTRPELCVLLSYAKITFTKNLMKSNIPDNPDIKIWLTNYFPKPLQKKYNTEIMRHRLAREIISTTIANSLINRMGPTFIKSTIDKTGASCAKITQAYIIVREIFDLPQLCASIEAMDNKVHAKIQLKAINEITKLFEYAIHWFLTLPESNLNIKRNIQDYAQNVKELRENINNLLTDSLKLTTSQRTQTGEHDGLPKQLAHQIAILPALSSACDIIHISLKKKMALQDTARTYFALGEYFNFDWLRQQTNFLSSENDWYNKATEGLIDQLYNCQANLTACILKDTNAHNGNNKDTLMKWVEKNKQQVQQLKSFFKDIKRNDNIDLPILVIAEQRLRNLYSR